MVTSDLQSSRIVLSDTIKSNPKKIRTFLSKGRDAKKSILYISAINVIDRYNDTIAT